MEISKPDGLGDIANLGLTLAEAKQLLAETPGRIVTAQCAGLVLAYSRRLFIQYYPRFTRFEAKTFLLEAVCFMDGVCPVCVIDNTSVLLAAGAGADAVIAPEMLAFARTLGFRFRAHRVGHPDRKGRIERPFAYVENNFLAARDFADFEWARATSSVPSVSRISI